ncbi:uncharacterized protein GGS22DRAFT_160462 [Annulohypoxylon maeteangense]|uniref:uncharacterized protein n=1 Tax=Annulohypoxylon maeteangense TaxID=1927788 RepID=UPI002008497E|nr:uncharacterized protein GGS22DRAFT_160462 [Annulohypoxylon maeteangense]KAI0886285.1 hypothetical protein GGS22DRAFT_160462 [Annulohypoxylon maeteangense]
MPLHRRKRISGSDGRAMSATHFLDDVEVRYVTKIFFIGTDIETLSEGVRVHLKDGATVEGSLVIGADGVHSKTRKLMQKLARDDYAENMVSNFYCIFGQASIADLPIEPEVFFESRGSGAAFQCLATRDLLQFVALKPLPKPLTERRRYTKEEMEEFAASIADVVVCPGITFGAVWARAIKNVSMMLNQEEGFMSRWHYDRIVLVGDSAHKSTSVNGLAVTFGLHSAAVLANLLQNLLVTTGPQPSVDALSRIFSHYQKERESAVKPLWEKAYSMAREVTHVSWVNWFWDRYILPWMNPERYSLDITPSMTFIRYGNVLSYVPFIDKQGTVPWIHQPAVQS